MLGTITHERCYAAFFAGMPDEGMQGSSTSFS